MCTLPLITGPQLRIRVAAAALCIIVFLGTLSLAVTGIYLLKHGDLSLMPKLFTASVIATPIAGFAAFLLFKNVIGHWGNKEALDGLIPGIKSRAFQFVHTLEKRPLWVLYYPAADVWPKNWGLLLEDKLLWFSEGNTLVKYFDDYLKSQYQFPETEYVDIRHYNNLNIKKCEQKTVRDLIIAATKQGRN